MVGNAGQYEVKTWENDHLIRTQTIDDPFAYTTLVPRGWRAAWAVLRGKLRLAVSVTGTNASHRVVFQGDYAPEPPRERTKSDHDCVSCKIK